MTRFAVSILLVLSAVAGPSALSAQAPAAGAPIMQAFTRYEAIRVLLADDKFDTLAQQATALAPLAGRVAGKDAQAAALRLAAATTLNRARVEFIAVSSSLVPRFLAAKLPSVYGFMCPLQDGRTVTWVQGSPKIQNPYFGHAWPDCGERLPASQ